jgi:hypothetical protein
MLRKEVPVDAAGGRLIVDVFGAVLAVLVDVALFRLGLRPRAARAVDAIGLVDIQQRQRRPPQRGLLQRVLERMRHRRNPGRPPFGRLNVELLIARIVDCRHRITTFSSCWAELGIRN